QFYISPILYFLDLHSLHFLSIHDASSPYIYTLSLHDALPIFKDGTISLSYFSFKRLTMKKVSSFPYYRISPDFLETRTFLPSTTLKPTRVASLLEGSINITLETWIGASTSTIPPFGFALVGFWCFLTILMPLTITRS